MEKRLFSSTSLASLAAVLLGVLVLSGAGGCQAIVNGEVPSFTCSGAALSECPPGSYCKGSGCGPCEPRDLCGDGYDNDCNGQIDDGPANDRDGDGFTFCGHVDAESGRLAGVDCDDNDPTVNPNAKEVCNGNDDDCDGKVDNGVCPEGQACVPKAGTCIESSSACTVVPCEAPLVCDPQTQKCVKPNVSQVGDPCSSDKECPTGICGDSVVLTAQVTTRAGGSVCTQGCCSSEDCPADFVCFAAGAGSSYCVKKDWLLRSSPLGSKSAGAACAADAECRSGSCANQRCLDVCCGDAKCAPETVCGRTTIAGHEAFGCVPPPGKKDADEPCSSNADCRSGYCSDLSGSGLRRCVVPCCGSSQCGDGPFAIPLVCNNSLTASGDRLAVCNALKSDFGSLPVGSACSRASECRSDRCSSTLGGCTDVCCVDADCGNSAWVCRPVPLTTSAGQFTALRCVPKS